MTECTVQNDCRAHLWEFLPSHTFCDATCQKFSQGSSVLNALHKITMELTFEKFHQVAHFVARHAAILCMSIMSQFILCMSIMSQFKRATWLIYATWHIYGCVWHDALMRVHMWDMTHFICDWEVCVTWLIHMCDWVVCVTWLIHMCDMTLIHDVTQPYVYVKRALCICQKSPIYMSKEPYDSFICVTWLWYKMSHILFIWLIPMREMTHSYVGHDSFHLWLSRMCDNMWLSLVFRHKHRALLTYT